MADGITMELDKKDLARINQVFDRLAGLADDQGLWDVVGAEGAYLIHVRLNETKADPETGKAWADWSNDYAERRPNKGGVLDLSGELIESANDWYEEDGGVVWGSNKKYAATMHYGAKKHEFKGVAPWGDIPARPWLGFSNDDIDQLVKVANDYVDGLIKSA